MSKIIKYETAQLAKEVGFDKPTLKAYDAVPMLCSHSEGVFKPLNYNSPSGGNYCSAPTLEELKDWLREEHNIEVNAFRYTEIDLYADDIPMTIGHSYTVNNWNVQWSVHDGTGLVMPEHYHGHGDDYYDTLEKGVFRGLEFLKTDE